MELPEPLKIINQRLLDHYGRFENGFPNWRIVWSDDQYEKRLGTFGSNPDSLIYTGEVTEVREVPKYGYMLHQYVLERILPVPAIHENELFQRTSYEPVWGFVDNEGNPLPPKFEVADIIIKHVMDRAAQATHTAKYKMPELEQQTPDAIRERIRLTQLALYGNETSVGDALGQDSAVGYGIRQRNDGVR